MTGSTDTPVILFDGVCSFCNATVRFLLRRDREGRFLFAPLQSEAGQSLQRMHGLAADALDTMILVQGEHAYHRSTAALKIARRLGGPWALLYVFIVLPAPLRDAAYNLVARNRYRWFGKQDACMVPTEQQRSRFLD